MSLRLSQETHTAIILTQAVFHCFVLMMQIHQQLSQQRTLPIK